MNLCSVTGQREYNHGLSKVNRSLDKVVDHSINKGIIQGKRGEAAKDG